MKLTWVAGETGTRSKMNEPFFVQSGTVSAGNVNLQIGPGQMKFPYVGLPVRKTTSQAFQLVGPQASQYYALFMTAQGTIVASGFNSTANMPDSPQVNAEYIGTVFTGSPINTANLLGPWNQVPGDVLETRGYPAVTPSRPRVMDASNYPGGAGAGIIGSLIELNSNCKAVLPYGSDPSSGTVIDSITVGQPVGTYPVVHASVIWAPSGALVPQATWDIFGSGETQVLCGLALAVMNGSTVEYLTLDQHWFSEAQNPDGFYNSRITTSFSAVLQTSGTDTLQTHQLVGSVLDTYSTSVGAGPGTSARVYGYSFYIENAARRVT